MRLLTANRHEVYLLTLAQVGYPLDVLTSLGEESLPWRFGAEKAENIRLLNWDAEVETRLRQRAYDLLIIHTIKDLLFFRRFPGIPRIFVIHIALYKHTPVLALKSLVKRLALGIGGRGEHLAICAVSPWKKSTWHCKPAVVIKTPPLPTQTVFRNTEVRIACIGNRLAEREEVDFDIYQQVSKVVPVTLVGKNPGQENALSPATRQDYLDTLRQFQVFLFILRYPWEDGFNLAMLEAMQSGMAVVSLQHPFSLVEHGQNGYLCKDVPEMITRLQELRANPERVRQMGERSQAIIREQFSTEEFVSGWKKLIDKSAF